ncbi:MAG TPA: hypothetical protein VEP89_06070, partial [Draconibacterium sp.]|nr:hypothetical protein [Draconibacterium sp.]
MSSQIDAMDRDSKDKRNNIIVIVLSVILVVVLVLFFLQRRDHRVIVNEINAEKDAIQLELTEISAGYDSLKTENDTVNEQLIVAQAKVKDLLLEVEQVKKVSYSEISDYKEEVNSLRAIMRDFYVQIDSLNRRNEQLMAENLEVKQQYQQAEQKNEQLNKEKE